MWSELPWHMLSEVSYVEVLGDKSSMHIRMTLYWGYLIVLWLFYLVCILNCGCFNLFFLICGVCMGFVMCGCFGNMRTCIYCVFALLHLCIFILCKLLFNFVSYVFLLLCLCTLVCSVLYILFSLWQLALFGYPDWGFSVLFLFSPSCKANARVELTKTWHGQHSSQINCVVLCIVYVLYYCQSNCS
jgi:hypothetical protein